MDLVDDWLVAATSGSGVALVRLTDSIVSTPTATPAPERHHAYLPATYAASGLRRSIGSLAALGHWQERALAAATLGDLVVGVVHVPGTPGGSAQVYLAVLDFSDPTTIRLVGRSDVLEDRQSTGAVDTLATVTVVGQLAYVTFGSGDLWVIDVAEPTRPRMVSRVEVTDDWSAWSGLELAGRLGFLYGPAGMRVIDLTDLRAPRPLAAVPPLDTASTGWVTDVAVNGATVWLTHVIRDASGPGLTAVDLGDLSRPRLLGSAFVGQSTAAVVSDGRLAYVAPKLTKGPPSAMSGGIVVLNVRDPAHIREVGYQLDGLIHELSCLTLPEAGTLLAAGDNLAVLWDISQPALPRQLAATGADVSCVRGSALAVAGHRAYLVGNYYESDQTAGIRALDWSVGTP